MKKLIYSTLSIAVILSAFMVGCKDTPPVDPPAATKGPKISFQTNTGTQSGYTFTDDKKPVSTIQDPSSIKVGVIITSEENLKSTKMTVKFNNQAETIIGTDSIFTTNTKSCTRDYYFKIPEDKGVYTLTAYATDKNATTSTAVIKITAFGKLAERATEDTVFSLKAAFPRLSAYDLLSSEAITASGSSNLADRDIVDKSTGATLSRSWTSQNGTEFIISGAPGTLNGKVYFQFQSEQDIIDAWNATSGKSSTITGIDDNSLIIARSTRSGSPRYYLIGVSTVNDVAGSDNDFYIFSYSE